ncbi:unnamed protein product [Dovyalis caffra]|uniref:Uncharacterized protein n=1 Tax=Dovyalis caffra TaxID=77055 RepID=A0AAV1SEZ5_9ROSI|nr:unnamed protein product [Dovyalis caffra]
MISRLSRGLHRNPKKNSPPQQLNKHFQALEARGRTDSKPPDPKQVSSYSSNSTLPFPSNSRFKQRGLCYKCEEKWHVDHRCRNKELHVPLIGEDGVGEEGEAIEARTKDELAGVEFSLNSVVGLS